MEETKEYIKKIRTRFEFSQTNRSLEELKTLSVLVIGDTIIDHYVFVQPKGRAIKDPILSVEYKNREIYAGGILAIANHISSFVKKVKCITLIGDYDNRLEFINQSLKNNIELKAFVKENSPTTVKKRIVDHYRGNKLFKIEYINDKPITENLTTEILNYLDEELPKYDLVIIGDFGHGFINDPIRRKLEEKAKFLAVNAQLNSSNMGYNYFTQYKKADFLVMNEEELRLPTSHRFEDIDLVIKESLLLVPSKTFLVTQGKKGCTYVKEGQLFKAPIIIPSVKDTIGAGDALFSISSLFAYAKADPELIPLFANCAGGLAANIMGNKESISKEVFLNFIKKLYKEAEEAEVEQYFTNVNKTLTELDKGSIYSFVKMLLDAYYNERTIYVFGNGGSAATASHFCGDLVKGVSCGLEKRFRAICLNDNVPAMMAIANDISYDDIFVEQLKNFLRKEDLVIGISGSGNSANIVKALEYAKKNGAKTLAICGFKGGKIKEISDVSIYAKIDDMEISEDIHNLVMVHTVKRMLTNELNNLNVGSKYEERIA